MQQQLLGDVAHYASERPDALLKGHILAEQSDLHGVIDADLFTWPTEVGESTYLREIARVVEWFDWTQNAKEVAPTLYQNVITQEERKRLGEYYTPRWLAKEITETVVDAPLSQRVLDPSCGSGTFIETAVEHILNHSGSLSRTETLKKLQENVVGIDIHPVAVQLAKATWVMAAADTIRAARTEGTSTGAVSAPIYLGDSMQLRYDTGTLSATQSIELETHETLPGHTAPIIFSIPRELARRQADIDRLVSEMATAIDEGRNAEHVADAYEMSNQCRQSIKAVAALMAELHAADRNHVWAYYIRNMIRPAVIAEEKVDRIIGNPPWLTYSQSADIIRTELREMSEQALPNLGWRTTRSTPRHRHAVLHALRRTIRPTRHSHRHGDAPQRPAYWTASEVEKRQLQAQKRAQRAQHRAEPSGSRTVGPRQRGPRLLPHAGQRGVCTVHRRRSGRATGAWNRADVARRLAGRLRRH